MIRRAEFQEAQIDPFGGLGQAGWKTGVTCDADIRVGAHAFSRRKQPAANRGLSFCKRQAGALITALGVTGLQGVLGQRAGESPVVMGSGAAARSRHEAQQADASAGVEGAVRRIGPINHVSGQEQVAIGVGDHAAAFRLTGSVLAERKRASGPTV